MDDLLFEDIELNDSLNEELTLESVNVTRQTVTPSDTNGFKSYLLLAIGDYDSIVTDYTYSNGSYTQHSVEIEPDYVWIGSALFVLVAIYCFFRIVGTFIEKI